MKEVSLETLADSLKVSLNLKDNTFRVLYKENVLLEKNINYDLWESLDLSKLGLTVNGVPEVDFNLYFEEEKEQWFASIYKLKKVTSEVTLLCSYLETTGSYKAIRNLEIYK